MTPRPPPGSTVSRIRATVTVSQHNVLAFVASALPTLHVMTVTVELPEGLAERLAAEAERRGVSVEDLAVETLQGHYADRSQRRDGLDAFLGSFDSGDPDWAGTDTHELRRRADGQQPR